MAGTAPDYDNVRWGNTLRVPQEAGKATLSVRKLSTIALGAITAAQSIILTPEQVNASEIIVTATGVFAVTLNLPAAFPGKLYVVFNNGAGTLNLKVTGQTGVTVATTKRALLVCESTDVARVTADT